MRLILGFGDISLTLRIYNNLPVTAKEPAEDGTQTVQQWSRKDCFEDESAQLRQPCRKVQG